MLGQRYVRTLALLTLVSLLTLPGCPAEERSLLGTWVGTSFNGLTGERLYGTWAGGGEAAGDDIYSAWLDLGLSEDGAFLWSEEVTYLDTAAALASCVEVTTHRGQLVRDEEAQTLTLTGETASVTRSSCADAADNGTSEGVTWTRTFSFETITCAGSRFGCGVDFDELILTEGELPFSLVRADLASEEHELTLGGDGSAQITHRRTYASDAHWLAGCRETMVIETTYTYGTTEDPERMSRPFSFGPASPAERVREGCASAADNGSATIPGDVAMGGLAFAEGYSRSQDELWITVTVADVGASAYPFVRP